MHRSSTVALNEGISAGARTSLNCSHTIQANLIRGTYSSMQKTRFTPGQHSTVRRHFRGSNSAFHRCCRHILVGEIRRIRKSLGWGIGEFAVLLGLGQVCEVLDNAPRALNFLRRRARTPKAQGLLAGRTWWDGKSRRTSTVVQRSCRRRRSQGICRSSRTTTLCLRSLVVLGHGVSRKSTRVLQ